MSVTKIIGTIGPNTNTAESLLALVEAGLDVVRLNGSHADLNWHSETIKLIKETIPEIPILLDIPGRKIRTAVLEHEPSFLEGDEIILTTELGHNGSNKVSVNRADLHERLGVGAVILADDGTLKFTVTKVLGHDIHCKAMASGTLRSCKGINVPYVELGGELITERDKKMVAFATEHKIDFIGISFVESAEHVELIRELTDNSWPRIVAKIENQGGMDNMDSIMKTADVIMIDRGDLSVETNLDNLVIFQKRIIQTARKYARPVIVATEVLHSMLINPFPTKAEVSDITNAVLDGCAATMLSGETAIGDYPVESIETMRGVLDAADSYAQDILDDDSQLGKVSIQDAMKDAAGLLCRSLPITKIVAVTMSGFAARMIASKHPRQPIIAVSNDIMAARSFNIFSGTKGYYADIKFSQTSTDHLVECLELLWRGKEISEDDLILVSAVGYPKSGNVMNLVQTHYVKDLKEALKWETL